MKARVGDYRTGDWSSTVRQRTASVPALPHLRIHAVTRRHLSQNEVDRALKTVHERCPEFFKKIAERAQGCSVDREMRDDVYRLVRDELAMHLGLTKKTVLLWEARRRDMYGSPV